MLGLCTLNSKAEGDTVDIGLCTETGLASVVLINGSVAASAVWLSSLRACNPRFGVAEADEEVMVEEGIIAEVVLVVLPAIDCGVVVLAVEPVVEVGSGIGRLNMGKGTTTAQVPSVFDCLSVIVKVDALVGIGAMDGTAVIE